MSAAESVTVWLERLKEGERDEATRQLWQTYFARLVRLAQARLAGRLRLASAAEDVALSAFDSFVKAVEANRFPRLEDRDDLWQVLLLITARKAGKLLRRELGARRGGGRVQDLGERPDDSIEAVPIVSTEPDPAEAAAMAEACERLLERLGDDGLRQVALWKLEGFTNAEIAHKLNRSVGTVERKLQLIRRVWEQEESGPPQT
jgi:DNA-directed RNA polymerase specialized sigma24 family protein